MQRLDSNEELKKYLEETYEELAVVRAQTMNQQGTLKMAFQHNYSTLEREMTAYKRSWKQTKENAEAEMEE